MEYERSLYRIYEKILENKQNVIRPMSISSKVCLFCSVLVLVSIFLSHLSLGRGNHCIDRGLQAYLDANKDLKYPPFSDAQLMTLGIEGGLKLPKEFENRLRMLPQNIAFDEDREYEEPSENNKSGEEKKNKKKMDPYFDKENSTAFKYPLKQNRTSFYMKGDIINFYLLSNLTEEDEAKTVKRQEYPYIKPVDILKTQPPNTVSASVLTVSEELTSMKMATKEINWPLVNHTVPIDSRCYSNSWGFFFTFAEPSETVPILDLLATFKRIFHQRGSTLYVYSYTAKEYWGWGTWELEQIRFFFGTGLQTKVYEVIYLSLGLMIISFAASLYTKVVSMLSPLILYAFLKCIKLNIFGREPRHYEIYMNHFYRAFSWIGIYLQTVQRNQRATKYEAFFILSIVLTLIFFYFTYIFLAHITTRVLFPNSYPGDLDGDLFGFMATIELSSLFFFRTRESLYFGPKIIFLSLLAFLLYVNLTAYGFYLKAFLAANFTIFGTILYLIAAYEIPASNARPDNLALPSLNRPRALYQPLFSLTWYHDLPPFWSLFMPLYDRTSFSPEEMSMVDKNFHLLNQHLRTRPDRERQAQNQQNQQNQPPRQDQQNQQPEEFPPEQPEDLV